MQDEQTQNIYSVAVDVRTSQLRDLVLDPHQYDLILYATCL